MWTSYLHEVTRCPPRYAPRPSPARLPGAGPRLPRLVLPSLCRAVGGACGAQHDARRLHSELHVRRRRDAADTPQRARPVAGAGCVPCWRCADGALTVRRSPCAAPVHRRDARPHHARVLGVVDVRVRMGVRPAGPACRAAPVRPSAPSSGGSRRATSPTPSARSSPSSDGAVPRDPLAHWAPTHNYRTQLF